MVVYAHCMLIFLGVILCVLLFGIFKIMFFAIKPKIKILFVSKNLEGIESVVPETEEGRNTAISRNEVVKQVLGKDKNLDDLARLSIQCCLRHEADLQSLWYNQDGTAEGLKRWLKETSHCCRLKEE